MPRGIDHLVLCVRDLKKARDAHEQFGFTMTPPAQHPFGTGNTLAQLDGCFLEVLSVTEPENVPPHDGDHFSFGAFNRDFLTRGEGISMLVLDSADEDADRDEFTDKGLHVHAPFTFQRQALQPDGDRVTVGFSLTFLSDPALPDMGFFTCRQWRPDLFWKPEYQRHANTASGLAEVLVVSAEPGGATGFLSAFADAPAAETAPGATAVATGRGSLCVLTPARLEERYPGAFPTPGNGSPFFAGYVLEVADPDATRRLWRDNGIRFHDGTDGPWLDPETGFGCIIATRRST